MQLNELKDNPGARKAKIRVGRGIGCSKGKTCGRGVKGQTSRTGVRINGFEGGQMPLHRRLPKRGFNSLQQQEVGYATVNLGDLERAVERKKLDAGKTVNLEALKTAGLVRANAKQVKLLAKGAVKSKLTLEVNKASEAAIASVKKAGGDVKLA